MIVITLSMRSSFQLAMYVKSNVMPLKINYVISRWLVDHMVELGFSRSLSEWIGSNLKRSGDSETWAFNLEGAVQMFNSYRFLTLII